MAQADARTWELQRQLPSDGRFRIVVFGGNISQESQLKRVNALGEWIVKELQPRYRRMAAPNAALYMPLAGGSILADSVSVIDVLLVHAAKREDVDLLGDLHEAYHPYDDKAGWDYYKVFVDGRDYCGEHGMAYQGYGIDEEKGAVVVVRPDGYIGLMTGLEEEEWKKVGEWFEGVLKAV
jgi:phenol 2-monooxygenase